MTATFSTGTEFMDWQELWCNRCAHDHDMHTDKGGGCFLVIDAMTNDERTVPQWTEHGYTIGYKDENGRDHEHTIDPVTNSLPAAIWCENFTPCKAKCLSHPNGARLTWRTRGKPVPR